VPPYDPFRKHLEIKHPIEGTTLVMFSPRQHTPQVEIPYQSQQQLLYGSYHQNDNYTSIPFVRSGGFLVRMFGERDAAFFIEALLKLNVKDVYLVRNVPGWHNALMAQRPSISGTRCDAMANNVPLWLLDFIPMPMDYVVPQKIWTPPNQSDWRRYVEQAHLRMPVFFVQGNGTTGLPLPRAVLGDAASLRGANSPAPLGGAHSTQIYMAVMSSPPSSISAHYLTSNIVTS
jgi:hypothetical protein